MTLNVAAATLNPGNPRPATITINAGVNNAVINLASGADNVTLGSNLQTVHGGSGADTINVTSASIGASIDGGTSGASQLLVSGGGTLAMGSSITNIATAVLQRATTAYNFTANGIAGLVVNDLNTLADKVTAGGAGQTLSGGAAGELTMVGFGSGVTTYSDNLATLNGDTIQNFSANDRIDVRDFGAGVTVGFSPVSSTQGTLTVDVNGVQKAAISLFGQLMNASFTTQSDGAGGTYIVDPPVQHQSLLVAPH